MEVYVINPPFVPGFSRSQRSPQVPVGGTLYYPYWLAYATGAMEQAGHEVMLVDAPAEGMESADIEQQLEEFRPGLIVVDVSTPSVKNDVAIAGRLKELRPEAFVLLVGTHVSALAEETLALDARIDGVAVGEYDYTVRDLANCLSEDAEPATVPGLVLRKDGGFMSTGSRALIEDLDALPYVSGVYHRHLDPRHYYFTLCDYPMVQLFTGRGCPYRCFYCLYPQTLHGHRFRQRSAENVVGEFEFIRQEMPEIREVVIEDDTFAVSVPRVAALANLMIERRLGMKFQANLRADTKPEALELLAKAGCRMATVGFESGNQEVLDKMHKGLRLEQSREFVRKCREVGILVHGCFMVGNPGETPETMQETLRFALELECDSVQFYPLFAYPGTEAYEWAKSGDLFTTQDFSEWLDEAGANRCVLSPPGLTPDEIVVFCRRAYRAYHLRPSYLVRKAWQALTCPREGLRSVRNAYYYARRSRGGPSAKAQQTT